MGPEAKLAKTLTAWLRDQGWEVYEEVSITGYGDSADIVAVRAPVVSVIECKTSLSLSVLGQARRWMDQAHQVYVAVPGFKRGSSFEGAKWVCETLGLGLLCITSNVFEAVRPAFRRKVDPKDILKRLRPEQQDGTVPAGTSAGRRYTPWRLTVMALEKFVQEHPGTPLREVVQKVRHHYPHERAARASLSHQIRKGIIKTVRVEGRDLKVFPV